MNQTKWKGITTTPKEKSEDLFNFFLDIKPIISWQDVKSGSEKSDREPSCYHEIGIYRIYINPTNVTVAEVMSIYKNHVYHKNIHTLYENDGIRGNVKRFARAISENGIPDFDNQKDIEVWLMNRLHELSKEQ